MRVMRQDLLDALNAPDPLKKIEAIRAIGGLGAGGAFAARGLAAALRDDGYANDYGLDDYVSVAESAAQALAHIGPPALPALLDGLSDDTVFDYPVKCYDQGAYIGDYASRTMRVSELARDTLRRMLRDTPRLVDVIAELGKTASDEDVRLWVKMLGN